MIFYFQTKQPSESRNTKQIWETLANSRNVCDTQIKNFQPREGYYNKKHNHQPYYRCA